MSDEPATSRSDTRAAPAPGGGTAVLGDPDTISSEARSTIDDPSRPVAAASPADASSEPMDLETATRLALLALPGRIAEPTTCPFLRSGPGAARPPGGGRYWCQAAEPAVPVGDRQLALLCQVMAHPTCPRYVRGEAAVRASLAPGIGRRRRGGPLAIGTALVLLVAAAAVALTSGLGALGDGAGSSPTQAAGLPGSAAPTAARPTGDGSAVPSGPTTSEAPVSSARPTLVATRDLPAAWRGLAPCAAPDRCYLYVVRRADTLSSIAARFETTVRRLRRLNPQLTATSTIRVRQELRVPPPSD